jgi:hypothetical protein
MRLSFGLKLNKIKQNKTKGGKRYVTGKRKEVYGAYQF